MCFLQSFKRTLALCTAAIFSGRFMRFHFLMSSLLRPQLTHRSPLSWQTEMQGFSISLAIVSHLWTHVLSQAGVPVTSVSSLTLLLRVEVDAVV